MKNPTRWMERTMRKTATRVVEAARALKSASKGLKEAIERTVERLHPVAIEILTVWVRRLIVAATEITIGWLLRRLVAPPKPSNVIPFPMLRPAS